MEEVYAYGRRVGASESDSDDDDDADDVCPCFILLFQCYDVTDINFLYHPNCTRKTSKDKLPSVGDHGSLCLWS